MAHYALELPPVEEIRERLTYAVNHWRRRNSFIDLMREMMDGRNAVKGPVTQQYKVEVTHTYELLATVTEKAARFMILPEIQVVHEGANTPGRSYSTELERALNGASYWMEMQSDGDVWSRLMLDAIALDEGVERIEAAPAAFWPELVYRTEQGKERLSASRIFEDPAKYAEFREEYKKRHGVPFRSVYVPLESWFPIREGPTVVECFELEERTLREIQTNPLFSKGGGMNEINALTGGMTTKKLLEQKVLVVHYCNQWFHAYYALFPSATNTGRKFPSARDLVNQGAVGRPVLLHHYAHRLGRVIYNSVGGRFGGWKENTNRIEAVMKGVAELNQDLDEYASQIKTNVRSTGWPTHVVKFDPEHRGADNHPPAAPDIKEGENIPLWMSESIEPLHSPADNPMARWLFDKTESKLEKLAGAPALFGGRTPGVDTGLQQSMQIAQSEHLDEKLEQHAGQGAINRYEIIMEYVRVMDETILVHVAERDPKTKREIGEFVKLDPAKLAALPRMSSRVKLPRPMDYATSMEVAIKASQDRAGPGTPMYDDDTILEKFLGEKYPDIVRERIEVQNERRKLMGSEFLQQMIAQRIGVLMADQSKMPVTPEQMMGVDPALLQATKGIHLSGEAAQLGGVDFENMTEQEIARLRRGIPPADVGPNPGLEPPPGPPGSPVPGAVPAGAGPPRQGEGGGLPTGRPQPAQAAGQHLEILQQGMAGLVGAPGA